MSLSAAKSRVMQARTQIETGRLDDVEPTLAAAEGFLAGLDPLDAPHAPAVLAQIAELRAEMAGVLMPEQRTRLSAAEGKLRQAADQRAMGLSPADVELTLDQAAQLLAGIPEHHTEAARAELAAQRARPVSSPLAAPTPPLEPTAPLEPAPAPAAEHPADVASARASRLVEQAWSLVESGRTEAVDAVLGEAAAHLAAVPASPERDGLLVRAEAVRAGMLAADRAEARRRRAGELDRQLSRAEDDLRWQPEQAMPPLRRVLDRLGDDDVIEALGEEGLAEYRGRVAALDERRRAALKASALETALPLVAELERRVAEGPISASDGHEVDRLASGLRSLAFRARQALRAEDDDAPAGLGQVRGEQPGADRPGRAEGDDAEIGAVRLRADAAEAALGALVEDWRVRMRAQAVHDRWLVLLDGVEDWADESDDPAQRPLEEPRLPKTREAVQRLRHFVRDDDGDEAPAIRAVYRAAAETFERAGVRLDAAFGAMLDDAERRPVPLRGPELDRPLHLATAARYTFEGTRFLEANVARAEALHERWQAEVAAVMTARRELYDRLAAEAGAAWPGIVAGHGPVPFAAGAGPGTTILLSRVHNRAGWDFDGGAHPFSLRHDGVVLAGDYEPHVLAALEHAWYELKLDVNDRIPWDVVAVVEGPGTVGERTMVPVRDFGTGLEIGKREEWPPVPCVRLRIIALHAGPVVA
ncbi:hypothetical protein ABT369_01385 [Dactylosporangium sp. NPDC000244]|uniref:hypothetical protein n=1 Tax=Dactylosporangium sp. NPDC000244 TaxID=3154365 RepID=UPI00332C66E4